MKIDKSLEVERRKHQNAVKNLIDANQNEIEKIKFKHEKHKGQIRLQNTIEINNKLSENDKKVKQLTERNEKILKNLANSIEQAREHARVEKKRITQQLDSKKKDQTFAYENNLNKVRENYRYQLEDIEHEAQLEMERLDNVVKNKREAFKEISQNELQIQKSSHQRKSEMNKNLYKSKRLAEENKYQKALTSLKKHNSRTLVREERKQQKMLNNRKEYFADQIQKTNELGNKKVAQMHGKSQEKYQKVFKQNEKNLQSLLSRKEKIINNFKQKIRKETGIQNTKNTDPFYSFKELKPQIKKLPQREGYQIDIAIPPHEAKNVKLTGSGRDLKLSFDRQTSEVKESPNGSKSVMKKVETLNSTVKVDEIINPKEMSKNYKNGVLTFKVGLA